MLNVDSFRKQLATESTNEYLSYLLNVYIDSQDFNTKDGSDFISLFNIDASSAGNTNDDYFAFLNEAYRYFLKKRGSGKRMVGCTEEEQQKLIVEAKNEMNSLVSVPGYLVFDTSQLRGEDLLEIEHQFAINVDAKDIYSVMNSILNGAIKDNDNQVDLVLSTRQVLGHLKNGYSDTIVVGSTTPGLDSVLRVIDSLPETEKAKFKRPCQFGTVIDGMLSYSSFDLERGMSARSIIGKAFIETIDNIIKEIAQNAEDFKMFADALESSEDKDKVRTHALRVVREVYPDIFGSLVDRIKEEIAINGIKPEYLFISDTVAANLHNTYGSIIDTEEVEEEVTIQDIEPEVDVVPVTPVVVGDTVIEDVVTEEVPMVTEIPVVDEVNPQEIQIQPTEEANDIPMINVEDLIAQNGEFSEVNPEETLDVRELMESIDDPQVLTEQEIDSLVEEAIVQDMVESTSVVVNDNNRDAYLAIGITEELLNTGVFDKAGRSITLYEYLESNDTLNKIPVDASVTLATDVIGFASGSVMTGADFISKIVVQYATKLGEVSVDELIDKYATNISLDKKEQEEKGIKGFFKRLGKK